MHVDLFHQQRRALPDAQFQLACLYFCYQIGRRLLDLRNHTSHTGVGILQREWFGRPLRLRRA
jgi:hypothetical protein